MYFCEFYSCFGRFTSLALCGCVLVLSPVPEAWILHNLQNDEIKLLRSAALVSHALGASRLSFLEFSCRCSNKPLAILEQELPDLFEDMPNASAEGLAMVVSELFNTSLNPASALRHIFQRLGESIRGWHAGELLLSFFSYILFLPCFLPFQPIPVPPSCVVEELWM